MTLAQIARELIVSREFVLASRETLLARFQHADDLYCGYDRLDLAAEPRWLNANIVVSIEPGQTAEFYRELVRLLDRLHSITPDNPLAEECGMWTFIEASSNGDLVRALWELAYNELAENDQQKAEYFAELRTLAVAGLLDESELVDDDLPACGDPDCNACPRPSQV